MAGALIGGAFLSASLQVLFDRLASRPVLDFFRGRKFSDPLLLKKLNLKLLEVNIVLNDAEKKQITHPGVKAWLDELKDAVYVADDLLDEIATKALQSKLEAGSDTTSGSGQVKNFFKSTSSPNVFDEGMQSRIEEILESLEYIAQQKDVLGLKQVVVGGNSSQSRTATTSLVDESMVFGRDDDKEKILEFLLSDDESSGDEIGVLTIVGMGGLGKTTLAQLVYNDSKVQDYFGDLKAWVCVSEEFDVLRITKTILEAINGSACESNDLNLLQVRLKEKLSQKQFLLILDDVWNESYNDWDTLRAPFRFGAKGSKIIVTTRSEKVASTMSSVPTHHLNQLLDEQCWSLFAKHAFDNNNSSKRHELEVIGKKIVKKCKGLPLAAKTLGGLLRSEADAANWYKIFNSELWELPNDKSGILPALRLSYHYLPSHLKCCFAYCSIIPKDYEFEKQRVILWWMAEGFLQDPHGIKQMEEIGDEYFTDIASKSFFQQSIWDESRFIMHDLVNDLAKYVSGKFSFRLEEIEKICEITEKTRHFSYSKTKFVDSSEFKGITVAKDLRTFLHFGDGENYLGHYSFFGLLPALRFLRVLSFSGWITVMELPDSLGDLNHLRYLDLSSTAIRKLPDSTSNLCYLQTLLLHYCRELTELPTNMGKLINLRHLDIRGTKLKEMPMHMSRLKNLQTLSTFIVGEHDGSTIKELRELNDLHGELDILNLENVIKARDAQECNLKDKVHIEELLLEWSIETEDSQIARDVLDKLQPQAKLEKLTIKRYGGTRFPDWLGDHSFSNMVFLRLSECKYCSTLPPVGQLPSLRELFISGFNEVVRVGSEFYGKNSSSSMKPFGSLEKLTCKNMPELEEWFCSTTDDEGVEFVCLRELWIQNCPKLKGLLPGHLPCDQLVESFPNDCESLKSLPEGGLLSLEELIVDNCPELESFPEGGLPSNLKNLTVSNCPKLTARWMEWGLQRLPNLKFFRIDGEGCEEESFPEEWLLPSSLTCLEISSFPNMKYLNLRGLQHLTSLQYLRIEFCPKLLQCLTEEGLPISLSSLDIWKCPLFEEWCQRETGEGWPKIAHIPNISFEWSVILDERSVSNGRLNLAFHQWSNATSRFLLGCD